MFLLLLFLQASANNCTFPQLAFGDLNLTSEKQFKELQKKEKFFVLGVSAKWCRYCCYIEEKLKDIHPGLTSQKIKLIRADLSTQTYLSKYVDKSEPLPHIYLSYNSNLKKYEYPTNEYIFEFIKFFTHPHQVLTSEEEVKDFLSDQKDDKEIKIIGFIFDRDEFEESYKDARIELIDWPHAKFGIVTEKPLIKSLKSSGLIFYLNCILHKRVDTKQLDLEFDKNIVSFLASSSVKVVEELTSSTFQVFKTFSLPMLVLFVDPQDITTSELLSTYEKAARDFEKAIKFVWLDGKNPVNQEKRRNVGLVTDTLPAMAFNLLDGRVFPFDETKKITLNSIKFFCSNFLQNRLKEGPKKVFKGQDQKIEEKFRNTPSITMNDLKELVFKEGTDVLLLIYESNNEKSLGIAPNFNKVALRYKELNIPSIKVYKIDSDNEPVQTVVGNYNLPAILFFPAFHKNRPFIQYTGEGKAVQLMFFAQKYADIKFELPELPHLSPDQVEAYWQQVGELSEEKREKVAAANENRDWKNFF